MAINTSPLKRVEQRPFWSWSMFVGLVVAVVFGAEVALVVVPIWVPVIHASLVGAQPKGYWYMARISAFVAYVLIWLSMLLGLSITSRTARLWPGGPIAFDLHRHTSLLGLGCAVFHVLILLGDRYIKYTLPQLLVPFGSTGYEQAWVGLGQVAIYGLALVSLSFYLRRSLGQRTWRIIHGLSFLVFALSLIHGLGSGTDSSASWAHGLYWVSGASVLILTLYRVIRMRTGKRRTETGAPSGRQAERGPA